MQVGTLVNWTKKLNNHPDSEVLQIPAIVNQVWEDGKNVSLFAFTFDGSCISRTTPIDQLVEIANPDELRLLLMTAPTILRKHAEDLVVYGDKIEEAFRRIGELEAVATEPKKGKAKAD